MLKWSLSASHFSIVPAMPVRVAVVKRARRRSFALLWAVPAWVGSVWAALRRIPPPATQFEVPDLANAGRIPTLRFSDAGNHRCTGCDLCVEICPTRVLRVESVAPSVNGAPVDLTRFTLDLGGCIGCGRCVEDCPEDALAMARAPAVAIANHMGRPDPLYLFERRGSDA
jgi:2-oxoglutarate ferredoxin oxidoreductase subunit delta